MAFHRTRANTSSDERLFLTRKCVFINSGRVCLSLLSTARREKRQCRNRQTFLTVIVDDKWRGAAERGLFSSRVNTPSPPNKKNGKNHWMRNPLEDLELADTSL